MKKSFRNRSGKRACGRKNCTIRHSYIPISLMRCVIIVFLPNFVVPRTVYCVASHRRLMETDSSITCRNWTSSFEVNCSQNSEPGSDSLVNWFTSFSPWSLWTCLNFDASALSLFTTRTQNLIMPGTCVRTQLNFKNTTTNNLEHKIQ